MCFNIFNYRNLASAAALCLFLNANAQRSAFTINDNWQFRMPDEKQWHSVNLPHTYNDDAYRSSRYYQGKGLYRKALAIPDEKDGKRYYLKLEGASKVADVTVNGSQVGSHNGGYTGFTMDITDYVKPENVIEITTDNSRKDITPISADFTFWGGIYRDVWLVTTPEQHFNMNNMGSDGIFISTPVVNEKEGVIKIVSEVTNDGSEKASLIVESDIFAPDGTLVQSLKSPVKLKGNETLPVEMKSKTILNPQLWTPETPSLYTIVTTLKDKSSGKELDRLTHKTGFRWFAFDGNKGFSLNGKPYKLRGFNRHQDQAPVGVAMDDEAHRRDVKLMKELGSNFVRISHYPQDNAILDLCDEIGLLVWEEIPIVNIVPDTPGYDDNCETNLREMIRQHYNHPSIIAWGYMNEILLTTPRVGTPEWEPCKERTVALADRLEKVLKEEDPSRNSVMAYNMTNLYNEIGLDLIDVTGWNLYQGWYVDKLEDFNKWCEDQHKRYPHRPMIISEWGAGSDRRIHSDHSRPFDFSMEYQQKYIEHYLPFIETTEWISGCAYWNFIDFNVAARQESMPRVNNKGVAYNNRDFKDVAYYFKSMWRNDIPVLRIASRDHNIRTGEIDSVHTIKIYSNLPQVELFVNSKSEGVKKTVNCNAVYELKLPAGESALTAKGIYKDEPVYDCMMITFNPLPKQWQGEEMGINVGSNCYFTSDVTNFTWLPDKPYTPGGWGYTGGTDKNTTSEIHNTQDGPVYQTWREGDFTYKIDAPEGDYEIELLMADVSRPAVQLANLLGRSDNEGGSDMSRFDITMCGKKVESNFSPADGENFRNAVKRRYIVPNTSGTIEIKLEPVQGNAILSGIKLRKL